MLLAKPIAVARPGDDPAHAREPRVGPRTCRSRSGRGCRAAARPAAGRVEVQKARLGRAGIAEAVHERAAAPPTHDPAGRRTVSSPSRNSISPSRTKKTSVCAACVCGRAPGSARRERPLEPVDLRQQDLLVALGDDSIGRRQQRAQRARGALPGRRRRGPRARRRRLRAGRGDVVDRVERRCRRSQTTARAACRAPRARARARRRRVGLRRRAVDRADAEVVGIAAKLVDASSRRARRAGRRRPRAARPRARHPPGRRVRRRRLRARRGPAGRSGRRARRARRTPAGTARPRARARRRRSSLSRSCTTSTPPRSAASRRPKDRPRAAAPRGRDRGVSGRGGARSGCAVHGGGPYRPPHGAVRRGHRRRRDHRARVAPGARSSADCASCVLERGDPGSGATRAAAGVLAPDPETPGFTALARRSAELWPAFAARARRRRLHALRLARRSPSTGDEARRRARWTATHAAHSSRGSRPNASAARCSTRTRRSIRAVLVARARGPARRSLRADADVVETSPTRRRARRRLPHRGGGVILAAGAWSSRRLARRLPVRPVKGQTLRLRGPLPATRIIRSEHVYIVPRATGETVLGATIEDAGFDETPTDEATELLLRQAIRAVPAVARARARRGGGEPAPGHAGRRAADRRVGGLPRRRRPLSERDPARARDGGGRSRRCSPGASRRRRRRHSHRDGSADVFRSTARPVVYPQAEHARLAAAIAGAWQPEAIPLPFDSFVRGVALHDRGYGELDTDGIGEIDGARWLEIMRRGFEPQDADPVVDLIVALHIRRLVGGRTPEFDDRIPALIEAAGVAEADALAADASPMSATGSRSPSASRRTRRQGSATSRTRSPTTDGRRSTRGRSPCRSSQPPSSATRPRGIRGARPGRAAPRATPGVDARRSPCSARGY